MYHINDTVSALKEVQRLLNVNETGIYDEKTKDAVEKIQKTYGIESVNTVDYATFNAILDEYKKEKIKRLNFKYLYNPKFPYVIGDMGDNVKLINDSIRLVLEDYVYEDLLPKGTFLNQITLTAANFLRKIFKMEPSEEIDEAFMNRLLLEKNAIEIKRKQG